MTPIELVNCCGKARVRYHAGVAAAQGASAFCVVLLALDDPMAAGLAECWWCVVEHAGGQVPYALGIAHRPSMQILIEKCGDSAPAAELAAVVAIAGGAVAVLRLEEPS